MIVFGLVSSIFDLLTFAALLLVFRADEATFQTTWFVVSLLTELGVVLILRTRGPAWRSRPSALLLWTTVAATVFALAVPFFGPWSRLFGFVPLSTRGDGHRRRDRGGLPGGDRGDEALVLPPQRLDARLTTRGRFPGALAANQTPSRRLRCDQQAVGAPVSREHRQPEAQSPKEQGGRQGNGNIDPDHP